MSLLLIPVRASLSKKYVMAITGVLLVGFVLGHMAGNLLIFLGRDAVNTYAQTLKESPMLLWTARIGLLVVFLLHVALGLTVSLENKAARPIGYACEDTVQASLASRTMLMTGLLLFAFVVYHLAHFTLGVVHPATVNGQEVNYLDLHDPDYTQGERHDVYRMVIAGFRTPWISISYLFFQVVLWFHLRHGVSSWFQSVGLNHPRYNTAIKWAGPVVATVVFVGNCSIVLAVWFGIIGRNVV